LGDQILGEPVFDETAGETFVFSEGINGATGCDVLADPFSEFRGTLRVKNIDQFGLTP
jgi:hypothetical protein